MSDLWPLYALLVVLAVAALLVSVRDWRFATLLLAAALPFEGMLRGAGTSGMKVLTLVAVLALVLHLLHAPALLGRLRANLRSDLSIAMLALVLLAAASTLWAVSSSTALGATFSFIGMFVLLQLFALLDPPYLRRAWAVLLFSAALSVPIGLAGLGLGAFSDEGRFSAGGLNPNDYAGLLVIVLFAAGLGCAAGAGALRVLAMLAVLAGVLWSGSRTGLVALLAAPVLFLVICDRAARRRAAGQAVVAYAAAGIAALALLHFDRPQAQALQERALTLAQVQDEGTWAGRLDIWRGGWEMIVDHPVLGTGAGNFPVVAPTYSAMPRRADAGREGPVAHSVPLGITAELGSVGLVLLLFLLWRALRRARALSAEHAFGGGLLLGIIGWILVGMTLSWEHAKIGYLLLGSLLALDTARATAIESAADGAPVRGTA